MIQVRVEKENDSIKEVTCKGHSGYAASGEDIVCSAVSAIVQTALLGIIDVSFEKTIYRMDDGYLKFSVPAPKSAEEGIRQDAILKTMILGVRDVEKGFRAFVKLEEN